MEGFVRVISPSHRHFHEHCRYVVWTRSILVLYKRRDSWSWKNRGLRLSPSLRHFHFATFQHCSFVVWNCRLEQLVHRMLKHPAVFFPHKQTMIGNRKICVLPAIRAWRCWKGAEILISMTWKPTHATRAVVVLAASSLSYHFPVAVVLQSILSTHGCQLSSDVTRVFVAALRLQLATYPNPQT